MLMRHPVRLLFARVLLIPLIALVVAGCDVRLRHHAAAVSRQRVAVEQRVARIRAAVARAVAGSVVLTSAGANDRIDAHLQGPGETAEPPALQALRQEIQRRYRVGLLKGGVVLIPRERTGVSSIEITDGTVAIDGALVTGREIRARLGRDAEMVLQLSYLDPDARRRLLQEEPGGTEAQQPASPPGVPPVPAPPPAEPPAPPRPEEWPEIDRTQSDARIRVGGDIRVGEREVVNGPVVAVGGQVTVDGTVRDNVVAVGGSVRLGPRADVSGDVTSVGGTIDRAPGARIRGHQNEVAFGFPTLRIRPFRGWPYGWWFAGRDRWFRLMLTVFRMLFVAVVALLVLLVARRPVERVADAAAAEPWKAGLIGLLAELFVLPAMVLAVIILAVSIIGIPLLLVVPPLIILGLIVAFVLGFSGIGLVVGRWFARHLRWPVAVPFGALLVGLLVLWLLTLAGRVVALAGWPLWIASATLLTVGFLVEYVAWTVGLGAALMTRFGNRPPATASVVVPPPPSAPAADAPDVL